MSKNKSYLSKKIEEFDLYQWMLGTKCHSIRWVSEIFSFKVVKPGRRSTPTKQSATKSRVFIEERNYESFIRERLILNFSATESRVFIEERNFESIIRERLVLNFSATESRVYIEERNFESITRERLVLNFSATE